jgi:hypothetical protein
MCMQREEPVGLPPTYTQLQPGSVDLTEASLEEAASRGALPAFYTLHIAENLRVSTAAMVRKLNATQLGNPLAPYINVRVEPGFAAGEWCLQTPRGTFGSRGYF